jgi:hypothetical protein
MPAAIFATARLSSTQISRDVSWLNMTSSRAQDGPAVAVDLSACPADRGVVKSLPMPGQASTDEPDVTFVVSKTKLECLKKKLQEPGVVLDPTAKISLTAC